MTAAQAKRALASAAAKLGARVEDDSAADLRFQVCAPQGRVWLESSSEHLVVVAKRGDRDDTARAVDLALREIATGLK